MTFILGLLLGGAAILFILQNTAVITVAFFAWQTEGSLALILIITALVAACITILFSIPEMFRIAALKRENRRLAAALDEHRQKLSETEGKLTQAEAPVVLEKTVVMD